MVGPVIAWGKKLTGDAQCIRRRCWAHNNTAVLTLIGQHQRLLRCPCKNEEGNNIKQGEFLTPGEKPDDSLWWKHERLHRHALNNYAEISKVFLSQRNELEEEFLQEEQKLLEKPDINKLNEFSELSLQKSVSILEKWLQEAESKPIKRTFAPLYNLYWKLQNKQVGYEMKKG